MARKKITDQVLKSWEEVNQSLKLIGEAQNEIAGIEAEMNTEIAKIKAEAKARVQEHENIIKVQELMIQQYASENRGDLKGKSYKLAFGTVGFRLSTKLVLPKEIKPIIENLRRNGMQDCLNTTVTVNKEILKTYVEESIIEVGASLKKEDTFWYEVEHDTVRFKYNYDKNEHYRHGLIAQNVRKSIGTEDWAVVSEYTGTDGETYLTMNYSDLIADLIATVQSQNERIKALEGKLSE